MPRSAIANQQIRDARREQILLGAWRVFAEKGLAGTTSAELAVAAGVSHGLLYHYFASKDAIYLELVKQALAGGLEVTAAALVAQGAPEERLRSLLGRMLEGLQRNPEASLLILQATASGKPDGAAALVRDYGRATRDRLAELIAQGQALGQVRGGNPGALATVVLSTVLGLSGSALVGTAADALPPAEVVMGLLRP